MNLLTPTKTNTAKIVKLNTLLPRILPETNCTSFKNIVDEILVNNSGSEVTAANITPPIKAPDKFVFLSSSST